MIDIRNHIPGYLNPFDRAKGYKALAFKHSEYLGGHELNHVQDILRDGLGRLGGALLANGSLISGGNATKGNATDAEVTWRLGAAEIFLRGTIHDVPAADVVVPATGACAIGVRLLEFTVDCSVDPNLKGLAPGTRAEGEEMAEAYGQIVSWGHASDGAPGDFFPIYQIQDGDLVRDAAVQQNDAFSNLLRLYDREAHGHYIVEGCGVHALGLQNGMQIFSIAEGTVNVWGYKNTRSTSFRLPVLEEPDIEIIENEPHSLTGGAPYTLPLRYAPLMIENGRQPATLMVSRQKTAKMVHGPYLGCTDNLPDPTAFRIVSAKLQNGTTFSEGSDFLFANGALDWSPTGKEPSPGDSYDLTYQYTATLPADAFTATSVTVNDGVEGSVAYVTYRYKMPRWDAIVINRDGVVDYVKGISSRLAPQKAYVGGPRMKLADVWNVWGNVPAVQSTGVKRITVEQERDMETRLSNAEILIAELRLKNDISSRDPVAKRGLFADPLIDDTYRDQGTVQTAAVFGGYMMLPITATATYLPVVERTLPYTEEIILEQGFITGSMKINPYQAFPRPIPTASLDPSVDIWSEIESAYTSDVTRRFYEFVSYYWDPLPGNGPAGHGYSKTTASNTTSEVIGSQTSAIEFIRQRDVSFTLTNFGPNETLTEVLFDGVPVTP